MGRSQALGKKLNVWTLTGGIGSGKSTVSKILSSKGCPVIDADQIARELRAPGGKAHQTITDAFGTSDPKELGKLVFSDPKLREKLEAILHPLIKEESEAQFEKASKRRPSDETPIIYEASQVIESKRIEDFAGVICVEAPKELRLKWIESNRGMNRDAAERVMNHQLTDQQRAKHADFIIENTSSLESLVEKASQVLDLIKKKQATQI